MQIIEQLEAKQRHYKRKIENMGTGLALFKISATDSQYGYAKYHFMFNNGRKPPLDIAIDIQDTSIEYISWFVQDEKLSFWRTRYRYYVMRIVYLFSTSDFLKNNIILTLKTILNF